MNIMGIGTGLGDGEVPKRVFVKKWSDFIEDFCYKEIATKEIFEPEDFMLLKLTETDLIEVTNDHELPPQGYEMQKSGLSRRLF